MSKRFSVVFNKKWLKTVELMPRESMPSSSFCSLSREDVVRFLISCLGALAPLPLTSVSEVNAISSDYSHVDASSPALEVKIAPHNVCAVVETRPDGRLKIVGEISAFKLWRCDLVAASWAMARFSAGQFVGGFEDGRCLGAPHAGSSAVSEEAVFGGTARLRKFSSRSIGFVGKELALGIATGGVGMYRGRSSRLTCRRSSSLAAVMAQMLSHRATQVWVTEEVDSGDGNGTGTDDVLVGVVSYIDIFHAVTGNRAMGASFCPDQ